MILSLIRTELVEAGAPACDHCGGHHAPGFQCRRYSRPWKAPEPVVDLAPNGVREVADFDGDKPCL